MLSRAWTYTPQDALAFYDTHPENGLSEQQVKRNRELYGENCKFRFFIYYINKLMVALPEPPATSLFTLILAQFKDQLVLILLGSAVVSFVLALFEDASEPGGSWMTAFVEPLVILLILIANATVGVVQETNAEKAIDVSLSSVALGQQLINRLYANTRPTKLQSSVRDVYKKFLPPTSFPAISSPST